MPFGRLAAILLVALAPTVAACTSSSGPFHAVRFIATEGGRTVVDLPTTLRAGPNDLCGTDVPPRLTFDGRYAAWTQPGWTADLRVVDVTTGNHTTYPSGALTNGHLALLPREGMRPNVTLLDLASGASRKVAAGPGESFVASFPGVVVAAAQASGNVSILDPVTGAWRLKDVPALRPSYFKVAAGDEDWVVFWQDAVLALEVATGNVTRVPLDTQAEYPYGIVGDRLYVVAPGTSSTAGPYGTPSRFWSLQLPLGTNRTEGSMPPQGPVGDRAVSFFVEGETVRTTTSGTPDPLLAAGGAGGSTPPSALSNPATGTPEARAAFAVSGALFVGLLVGAALVRRRLE